MTDILGPVCEGEIQLMPTMMPVCTTVTFTNHEVSAVLDIKDDVTPLECLNVQLMIAAGSSSGYMLDWAEYIERKQLGRHFIITNKDKP